MKAILFLFLVCCGISKAAQRFSTTVTVLSCEPYQDTDTQTFVFGGPARVTCVSRSGGMQVETRCTAGLSSAAAILTSNTFDYWRAVLVINGEQVNAYAARGKTSRGMLTPATYDVEVKGRHITFQQGKQRIKYRIDDDYREPAPPGPGIR